MSRDVKIILKTAADITGLTKLKRALEANVPGLNKLEKGFGALGRSIKKIGGMGVKAFKGLSVGLAGVTAALAGSVREFASFNVGMARAWTMMDVGIGEFREIRSQVVDLSAELGVAKDQLSQGLYQALSAGVPKDNAISFISTAAKVAVADGSDVATAVDGITTVLNAWGLEAEQADEVTDKLFKTVANGKTTFGELASSISQAAPVAASMGVSVDELLASVATLTKQGMPTAQAMTVIRNALTLTNDQLGDGWAATRTFQQALNEIATTAGNSQQALTKIFGRETVAGISALTGANFSGAASDLSDMANSAGSLDGAFGKVSSQTSHWPRLWQTLRAYITGIGEALDTRLRPSINYITEKLNEFRKGDTFEGFAGALAEAVTGFITKLLAGIITAGQALKTAFQEGPTAIAATLKTLITEALTLAGTALIEFLRANVNVFVMLGKVVGNAIKAEVLKLNIPGLGGTRKEEGARGLQTMTYAEAQELFPDGLPGAGGGPRQANARILPGDAKVMAEELAKRDGGRGILAGLAGRTSGDDMLAAIQEGRANFAGAAGRLGSQFDTSVGNIATTGSNALGMDLPGMFQDNYNQIADFQANIAPPAAAPQPPASSGAGPSVAGEVQDSGKAVEQELQKVIEITLRTNDGTVKKIEQLARAQEEMQAKLDNLPVQ